MYYICLYHKKKESAMIELKSSFKNNTVVYTAKRKKCKKSMLWAARLNNYSEVTEKKQPVQMNMFYLPKKQNTIK